MSFTTISIGLPHPMWQPQAVPGATFDDELGLFVIGLPNPKTEEIEEFQGPGRLGLMKHRRISVLTLTFGAAICLSTPYHASRVSRDEAPTPAGTGEHRLLQLCLVDAATGMTVSMRAATLSPHVTAMLQHDVCQQVANPISLNDFLRDVHDWDSTYPTERSVIRASTWCRLGD